MTPPPSRRLVGRSTRFGPTVLAAALVLSACGSADETGAEPSDSPGPTVADARFGGTFAIESLSVAGAPVELGLRPLVSIETEFGALAIEPGCNIHYGSYTLTGDGAASFTVTGGSKRSCPELGDQDDLVLDAVARVDGWSERDDLLVLTGDDVAIELSRAG